MTRNATVLSRRDALTVVSAALLVPDVLAKSARTIIRAIPASGERLPVIGLGTNAYGVSDPAQLQALGEVLQQMPAAGGKVIDTAQAYGSSEEVLGAIMQAHQLRGDFFIATKTAASGDISDVNATIDRSFKRLQTERIDLLQIHNLYGLKELLPALSAAKASGRVRYIGVTTSRAVQHADTAAALRAHAFDFVQLDYSIDNRGAAETLLPLARDRGVAVLVNLPFGGRRGGLLAKLASQPLPGWAKELSASSWSQVLLKYVLAQSAVTCVIPGTTKAANMLDNQAAGRGDLPDKRLLARMESDWEKLRGKLG